MPICSFKSYAPTGMYFVGTKRDVFFSSSSSSPVFLTAISSTRTRCSRAVALWSQAQPEHIGWEMTAAA